MSATASSGSKGTGGCTSESGTCAACRHGCAHKPGWFLPGEAEKAAEFMGMTLPEFFRAYLAVDWWEGDGEPDIFLLSPAIAGAAAGAEFPGSPLGECLFYEGGRCRIHPVKPHECREAVCTDTEPSTVHEDTAMAWKDDQGQIAELLGRDPVAAPFYGGGLLGLLQDMGL